MSIRTVLARIAGSEELERNTNAKAQQKPITRPVTEDQAAITPAKPQTAEVARILAVWRNLGVKNVEARRASQELKPVGEHLATLRVWQAQWGIADERVIREGAEK